MAAPHQASSTLPSRPNAGSHPSGDSRFKLLDAALKKNRYQPDALIEILHSAQGLFGYLREDVLLYLARSLKLPPSRVFGVATFYHLFALKPEGEHTCTVCLGTACYVKGASEIVARIEQVADVRAGKTTSDGLLSLRTARCIGACGVAPAIVYDGVVAGHQTADQVTGRIREWISNGEK